MNDKENDPNDLLVCPYDAVHRISRKRYPYHLAKCRKVSFTCHLNWKSVAFCSI